MVASHPGGGCSRYCNSHGCDATFDLIVEDIKTTLRNFINSKVCHVRKFANLTAHRMVKLALISNFNSCWFDEALEILQDVLLEDCMISY